MPGSGSRPRAIPGRWAGSTRRGRQPWTGHANRSAGPPRQQRWVLTQYPTAAYAADARMDPAEYEAYVASAMFLDRPDPVAAWQELGRRQSGLVEFMSRVETVRIEADGTDLTLSVAGRTWINSDGRRNMPSGEIFTGPVEDSAQGRLRCGFPVCRGGRELVGIALEFDQGRVVSAHARRRAKITSARCSTSTPARAGSASWDWG